MATESKSGCVGGCLKFVGLSALILVVTILALFQKSGPREQPTPDPGPVATFSRPAAVAAVESEPEARRFFAAHPDLGTPSTIESVPDWLSGRRRRVAVSDGRVFLLYFHGDEVVTVWRTVPFPREVVWGKPNGPITEEPEARISPDPTPTPTNPTPIPTPPPAIAGTRAPVATTAAAESNPVPSTVAKEETIRERAFRDRARTLELRKEKKYRDAHKYDLSPEELRALEARATEDDEPSTLAPRTSSGSARSSPGGSVGVRGHMNNGHYVKPHTRRPPSR